MNVALLCGGISEERLVSVQSAKNIYKALRAASHVVEVVYITPEGEWKHIAESDAGNFFSKASYKEVKLPDDARTITLTPGSENPLSGINVDVCFPILHGPGGEDGTLQGLLELCNLPYVGPDVVSSAVCMDKIVCKTLLEKAGIKTAPYIVTDSVDVDTSELNYPLFVKPPTMGSSVGVSKVTRPEELPYAIELALSFGKRVLIEQAIEGRELECAVLGNKNPKSTGPGEVVAPENFYSYEAKYINDTANVVIPAEVTEEECNKLKSIATAAYKTCLCEGMARVDLFLTPNGEVLVNEINTLPGFTQISMYPKLWENEGVSYAELVTKLIELAVERARR